MMTPADSLVCYSCLVHVVRIMHHVRHAATAWSERAFAWRRLYRTNGLPSRINYRNRVIWCGLQCCGKGYFEKCPKHYTRSSLTLTLTPTQTPLCLEKIMLLFFPKKMADYTKSHITQPIIPRFPYFFLYSNSVMRSRLLLSVGLCTFVLCVPAPLNSRSPCPAV